MTFGFRNKRRAFELFVVLGIHAFSTHAAYGAGREVATLSGSAAYVIPAANTGKSYDGFLAALRKMESGGNYKAVNTLNFIGAYQFGEAALIDLGYVRRDRDPYDNNYGGGFTGKNGIRSIDDFLNNRAVQDKAAKAWMKIMWKYIEADGLRRYAWRKVGDVQMTPSGMLAAAHLLGSGALKDYIRANGQSDFRDPYGTPLSKYINTLAGYDVPFGPSKPAVVASL
ncbi:MAG: hypothetical protein BA874_01435 [Desulfuromonadales bacterium C00003068]|nr:MAG: hypothetical protein BA874_01435 [Desulfuromonadales bacterium C00003068]